MAAPWMWIAFNLFILGLLALDLGLFHRRIRAVSLRESGIWTAVWVALALAFNAGIYRWLGRSAGLEFLTGYLIEKSLSVDNIFVFVLIFSYFKVAPELQHRVLFWGILGALVMRAALILAGAALLARFHWIIYVFGGFLVITGIKMAIHRDQAPDPGRNPTVRLVRRLLPVAEGYAGEQFLIRAGTPPRLMATPLLLVLIVVEVTDLIFAVDSIPAIFAVTREPFIVYTSNVFAILGLRSLYFLLAGVMGMFRYLKLGLAAILSFVGVKMLLSGHYKIPVTVSLGVIAAILAVSVIASLLNPEPPRHPAGGPVGSA